MGQDEEQHVTHRSSIATTRPFWILAKPLMKETEVREARRERESRGDALLPCHEFSAIAFFVKQA